MMFGATSCGSSAKAPETLADSAAVYMGRVQGAQFSQNIVTIPEPDRSKFQKEAFLRGLKQAVMTDTADLGYIYGLGIGANMWQQIAQLKQSGIDIEPEVFFNSFAETFLSDSLSSDIQAADMANYNIVMEKLQKAVMEKRQEMQENARKEKEAEAEGNVQAGKEYVEKAKAADSSIKTTESGLSYKVIKQGSGATPTDTQKVNVKYTGKLIDGTQFDSSNGEAVPFPVSGVIPGFAEGLKMMNPGSTYILYIPSDLAYGVNGTPTIPAGSTLVFEVEMVGIED